MELVKNLKPIHTEEREHYTINQYWFGYQSFDKDNNPLIRSASLEDCDYWTDQYLKAQQEGWSESRVVNDGKVGGKL